jgi:hypothetical protein
MTTRYINVTLGTKSKVDNTYATTTSHGGSVVAHVTLAYDDAVITSQDALIQGVRSALAQALGNASLTR